MNIVETIPSISCLRVVSLELSVATEKPPYQKSVTCTTIIHAIESNETTDNVQTQITDVRPRIGEHIAKQLRQESWLSAAELHVQGLSTRFLVDTNMNIS